jgi:hypothetical protein
VCVCVCVISELANVSDNIVKNGEREREYKLRHKKVRKRGDTKRKSQKEKERKKGAKLETKGEG